MTGIAWATRTVGVARYLAADVIRSQRFLLPLVVHGAVLAVLFGGDPGPPPVPWAASALLTYPVAAWFALIVANIEDPVQRTVTASAAGGRGAVAAGTLLVALVGDLVLCALAVVWPLVVTNYAYPPPVLLLGALAHIACATAGTGVGLLCARPLVHRIGWSFCLAVTLVVVSAVQPWLPPVGTAVSTLSAAGAAAPIGSAVLGVALAAAAATACWSVDRRR